MATTVEYNKIHALAQARRKVIQEFGSNMLNFWPMADDNYYIRDLLRQKSLVAVSPVAMQASGLLDYGADLGDGGYISDVVKNQGGLSYSINAPVLGPSTDWYLAVPIPAGRWTGVKFRHKDGSGKTPAVYVAPPSTNPSQVSSSALFSANSTTPDKDYVVVENANYAYDSAVYGQYKAGQKITLDGKIDRVWFPLKKWGNPSGTISCKIYRVSDAQLLATASNTYDAYYLTTSYDWKEFRFDGVSISNTECRVVIEFPYGDSANGVMLPYANYDYCSGCYTFWNLSQWVDQAGSDFAIKIYRSPAIHTATFPFVLDTGANQWWAYLVKDCFRDGSGYGISGKQWTGSAWSDLLYILAEIQGVDPESWPSYDNFTIGIVVDAGASPANGVLLCIADASELKAQVFLKSDKKVEGKFKNANGDVYTLTSTRPLHPGFNLVTLSYEKNVAVKLSVNGQVVATTTPTNFGLFNATLALCIGAQMLTGKTLSNYGKKVVVDDVFLAKGIVTDAKLWEIYLAYITAAPLMLTEAA